LTNDSEELNNLYSPTHPTAADLQAELRTKLQAVNQPFLK